jgi:hypothetical protein
MADQQLNIKLNAIDNTTKAFSSIKNSIFSVRTALLTIASSVVVKQIVDVTKEFEQLRTTLRFVTGSVEGGQRAFNQLKTLARQTQFSTAELSNAFVTLTNAGIEPTDELLKTFIDTASVTANSLDTLNDLTRLFAKGATGAGIGAQSLSQLAGKGIPVFQILEKELGLTRTQINKFAEDADGSKEILSALERGLAQTFGGASAERAGDLGIVIKNLFEDFKGFADLIGTQGGFSKSFKELLISFGQLLETLRPVILLMGKLLTVVVDTAKGGFDLLNVTLQGTLNLLTKIGKATGFGSNLPARPFDVDEDRTLPPPEIKTPVIEDKTLLGIIEGKLRKEAEGFDLAFRNINRTVAEGALQGIKGVSTAIAESIILGKKLSDTFRELAQKVLVRVLSQLIEEQLVRIAILALEQLKLVISKQQTAEIVKQNALLAQRQAMGGDSGGGFFGSLLSIGASIFGGGSGISGQSPDLSAEGGAIKAGNPYIVGERGRELFVPSTSGTMIPNHDLAGTGMNITFNIQANDVRGIKELLIDNRATIINLVNQGANQKGKSNIV